MADFQSAMRRQQPGFRLNENYDAANAALQLTPQEQALYQRHLSNLWGNGGVTNQDGSRSSLYQMGVTGPGGLTYNLPTVYNGQILSPDSAIQQAAKQGWNTFPSYPTSDAAEARYQAMHNYMDRDTGNYLAIARPDGAPFSLF